MWVDNNKSEVGFPSPYGVSFILIRYIINYCKENNIDSFRLLTEYHSFLYKILSSMKLSVAMEVSVSLWSIIHSYLVTKNPYFNNYSLPVSVSLWSIIHSYSSCCEKTHENNILSQFPSPYGVSFILIIYSLDGH